MAQNAAYVLICSNNLTEEYNKHKRYYCSSCSLDTINIIEVLCTTTIFYLHSHVILIGNGAQVVAHCSVNTTTM